MDGSLDGGSIGKHRILRRDIPPRPPTKERVLVDTVFAEVTKIVGSTEREWHVCVAYRYKRFDDPYQD